MLKARHRATASQLLRAATLAALCFALAACGSSEPEASTPAASSAGDQAQGTTRLGVSWVIKDDGECASISIEGQRTEGSCPARDFAVLGEVRTGQERVILVRLPKDADLAIDGPKNASLFDVKDRPHAVVTLPPSDAGCSMTAYSLDAQRKPVGRLEIGSGSQPCGELD